MRGVNVRIGLYIILEPARGKPVTLARVNDRELLTEVAVAALDEAERAVHQMASEDPVMGELQRQEATRLRTALELVLPAIRGTRAGPIM
jgi:hypothetical protein